MAEDPANYGRAETLYVLPKGVPALSHGFLSHARQALCFSTLLKDGSRLMGFNPRARMGFMPFNAPVYNSRNLICLLDSTTSLKPFFDKIYRQLLSRIVSIQDMHRKVFRPGTGTTEIPRSARPFQIKGLTGIKAKVLDGTITKRKAGKISFGLL